MKIIERIKEDYTMMGLGGLIGYYCVTAFFLCVGLFALASFVLAVFSLCCLPFAIERDRVREQERIQVIQDVKEIKQLLMTDNTLALP